MLALQSSPLPEAAEVLDILHQIEFESLFYTHDKLAERQVTSSWIGHLQFWPHLSWRVCNFTLCGSSHGTGEQLENRLFYKMDCNSTHVPVVTWSKALRKVLLRSDVRLGTDVRGVMQAQRWGGKCAKRIKNLARHTKCQFLRNGCRIRR